MKQTYFWKDFVLKCGQQRTTHYSRKITVFPTLILERNQEFPYFYIFPLKTVNCFSNPTATMPIQSWEHSKAEKQIRSSRVVVFWKMAFFALFLCIKSHLHYSTRSRENGQSQQNQAIFALDATLYFCKQEYLRTYQTTILQLPQMYFECLQIPYQ